MASGHAAQVTLRWSDNSSNETGFKIERALGSGSFSQIATTGRNTTQYTDTTVASNRTYRFRVRAYNSAGNSGYSNTASITTTSNSAPTLTGFTDRTIPMNGSTGAIAFRISDSETSASSLTLIKSASNKTLVPLNNIVFGGSGSNRTVTIRPAANKTGWSTIWIKVSDGKLSTYRSFVLSVSGSTSGGGSGKNTAPTLSQISDRTIATNGTTGPISFTIGDAQTDASKLTLIRSSSNQTLVPVNNITFGGTGSNRTVTIRPAGNRTGWSTIWIKVSDGELSRYIGFVLTVRTPRTAASIGGSSATSTSTRDRLRLDYVRTTGDAEMIVRVTDLVNTQDSTRGGLMFRASTATNAACAGVYVTGGSRLIFVHRRAAGEGLRVEAPLSGRVPHWLRLTRVGNTFYAFESEDGKTWDLVEFARVTMPTTVIGGTAATQNGTITNSTATFSGFVVD